MSILFFFQGISIDMDFCGPIKEISSITNQLLNSNDGKDFCSLIREHENILAKLLDRPKVKDQSFSDFDGEIKSLGAWGGDFILAYSENGKKNVQEYFKNKGLDYCFSYEEIISEDQMLNKEIDDRVIH